MRWTISIAAAWALGLLGAPSPAAAEGPVSLVVGNEVTGSRYSAFAVDRQGVMSPEDPQLSALSTVGLALSHGDAGAPDDLIWEGALSVTLVEGALAPGGHLEGDDLPGARLSPTALDQAWLALRRGRRYGAKVGLMGSAWGLGLVAHDGGRPAAGVEGWFKQPMYGDQVLRGALHWMPVSGLLIAGGVDRVWSDDIAEHADGDVAHQGVFAVRQFFAEDRWVGAYVVRRVQRDAAGKALEASVADVAGDFTFGPWRARGEAAYIRGTTELGASADHPEVELERFGAALRLVGRLAGGVTADLEGAWLSGDATMDDGRSTAFRADGNFQQGLVLFPRVLATWTGRARLNASDPQVVGVPAEDLDKLATGGALSGVATLFPKAGWRVAESTEVYLGALLAWASADVLDPFNTRVAGGIPRNHLDAAADGSYLGTEWDAGVRIAVDLPGGLGPASLTAEYGVLSPGGALAGLETVHGGQLRLELPGAPAEATP